MSYRRRLKDVVSNLSQRYIKVILRCLEDVLNEMTDRSLIKKVSYRRSLTDVL